jgi:1-acyl-sn-glycerol-3-phosphate acyltransferase
MFERSLTNRLWYEFLRWQIFFAGTMVFRLRYSGRHNIPPTGPVLVVSNHQSHFDPPFIGAGSQRRMNYLARETLFRFAPLGWLIRSLDAIPIDRDGLGLNGIKEALRRLKRGEMVLIFPEGTRSLDGEISPFRPGFTVLAARSKAWVMPVAIEGAFAAWPRSRKLPRKGAIHVHYGEPFPPEEVASSNERILLTEIERRVRQCQSQLREHPTFGGKSTAVTRRK